MVYHMTGKRHNAWRLQEIEEELRMALNRIEAEIGYASAACLDGLPYDR